MIQVNRIYLIFNRLVTKKFLVDTSAFFSVMNLIFCLFRYRFRLQRYIVANDIQVAVMVY